MNAGKDNKVMDVKELIEHMRKYKDTLILFGENGLKTPPNIDSSILTNKNLVREPDKFWSHYFENLLVSDDASDAQKVIMHLDKEGLLSGIINLTFDDKFQNSNMLINIHGLASEFKCSSCKITYTKEYVTSFESGVKCEVCGKPLRPNILLTGERYFEDKFNAFKQMVLNTHTLFIVGLDWNEDAIVELIASFGEMKDMRNLREPDKRIMVSVGADEVADMSEIGNFEFIVHGDVNESMIRFAENLKN